MAELGALEAMTVQGAQEAMAGGLSWPWPRPGHSSRNPSTPPKKFPGEVRGYQEPSGARQTGQYRTALRGQTDRTRHPTGTGSPPGLFSEAEASFGILWHQGPSQGPSATASNSTTRGAACPRRVSVDTTRQGSLKCSCGHNKTQTRLSWPWRVGWIHGARVSGDPAGLSQQRSGGHWVRGGPAAWSPVNGGRQAGN